MQSTIGSPACRCCRSRWMARRYDARSTRRTASCAEAAGVGREIRVSAYLQEAGSGRRRRQRSARPCRSRSLSATTCRSCGLPNIMCAAQCWRTTVYARAGMTAEALQNARLAGEDHVRVATLAEIARALRRAGADGDAATAVRSAMSVAMTAVAPELIGHLISLSRALPD